MVFWYYRYSMNDGAVISDSTYRSVIRENLERVRERISDAARRAGRNPDDVALLVVTKTVEPERIRAAYECGVRLFGENRVQEARDKRDVFGPDSALHLIGHLQRNKAKLASGLFSMVHSIDSAETAAALAKECAAAERTVEVLLELNTSGEESKHGVRSDAELFTLVERTLAFPQLAIRGLMTVAPFTDDRDAVRGSFRRLARTAAEAAHRYPEADFGTLSMGMSQDYEIAIEEGSTLVRIGTAIFGERLQRPI